MQAVSPQARSARSNLRLRHSATMRRRQGNEKSHRFPITAQSGVCFFSVDACGGWDLNPSTLSDSRLRRRREWVGKQKGAGGTFLRSRNRQINELEEQFTIATRNDYDLVEGNEKSHLRNQKRFHSRYNFGYGILLSIRKTPHFRPLTAHFGGFEGVFSYKTDKSAFACPDKTEVADFVCLRVQSFKE